MNGGVWLGLLTLKAGLEESLRLRTWPDLGVETGGIRSCLMRFSSCA